jgi:hypothetical protein
MIFTKSILFLLDTFPYTSSKSNPLIITEGGNLTLFILDSSISAKLFSLEIQ